MILRGGAKDLAECPTPLMLAAVENLTAVASDAAAQVTFVAGSVDSAIWAGTIAAPNTEWVSHFPRRVGLACVAHLILASFSVVLGCAREDLS